MKHCTHFFLFIGLLIFGVEQINAGESLLKFEEKIAHQKRLMKDRKISLEKGFSAIVEIIEGTPCFYQKWKKRQALEAIAFVEDLRKKREDGVTKEKKEVFELPEVLKTGPDNSSCDLLPY